MRFKPIIVRLAALTLLAPASACTSSTTNPTETANSTTSYDQNTAPGTGVSSHNTATTAGSTSTTAAGTAINPVTAANSESQRPTTGSTTFDTAGTSGAPAPDTSAVTVGSLGDFTCPQPPYASTPVQKDATAQRIVGVPPIDGFATSSDTVVLEGPVWLDGNLYLSQINTSGPSFGRPGNFPGGADAGSLVMDTGAPALPPSRILKLNPALEISIALNDAGTNGLAIDANGSLVGCNHKTGSVSRLSLSGEPSIDLVSSYQEVRFNSPNDLTFGADGTLYFTDPDYQAPSPAPQAETRAYRVPPGTTTAIPIVEGRRQPNGIVLSPARTTLYVSASDGVVAYPVLLDGDVGPGVPFAQDAVRSSDGMAVDCAGNVYTTGGQSVVIVDPNGTEVGRITVPDVQATTNVAFGGADRTTLYITALGADTRAGLFQLSSAIPGMPY